MPAVVALSRSEFEVDPGQTVSVDLTVSNTGNIVEQFSLEILGEAAAWAEAVPPSLSLFPGSEQTASIRFAPPRLWSTRAGARPFAVKVTPSNEPDRSVVEEGTLTVTRFDEITGELVPRISNGRTRGRTRIAIDNRGNWAVPATLSAADPQQALGFHFVPEQMMLVPGQAAFAKVKLRPHQRFWRGTVRPKAYKVEVLPEDTASVTVDGMFNQRPLLPRGVLSLLVLGALAALWFLLFKPAIESTAKGAVTTQLTAQQAQTGALASQLATTNSKVSSLGTSSSTTTTTAPATGFIPTSGSLSVTNGPAGQTTQSTYAIPSGATLSITDLVFENVTSSQGEVRLERSSASATEILFQEDLNTLTDKDYHFTTPVFFNSGDQVVLSVACGSNQPPCSVNLFYSGQISKGASSGPSTATAATGPASTTTTTAASPPSSPATTTSTTGTTVAPPTTTTTAAHATTTTVPTTTTTTSPPTTTTTTVPTTTTTTTVPPSTTTTTTTTTTTVPTTTTTESTS